MVPIRLAEIDKLIQNQVEARAIAGAVTLVTRQGEVVHESAIGMMDVEAGKPMQPDTIFRIASMIKPITAVAVLVLVDEGRFALDDPIAAFLPEFAEAQVFAGVGEQGPRLIGRKRDITIRHLLTHTSGMCLGVGGDEVVEALWTDAVAELIRTPGTTLQSAVQALAALPLAGQPGTAWRYGLSFEALAALVEVVSGEWFDQFLRRRLFEPLGMVDSGYVIQPENAGRLSALYASAEQGGLSLLEAPADSPQVIFHGYESGSGWTTGGDGLVSTATDYGRFLQMLLNGGELDGVRLLLPETVLQMRTNQLVNPGGNKPIVSTRGRTPLFPPWNLRHRVLVPEVQHTAELDPGYGQGLALRVLTDTSEAGGISNPGEFTHAGGHGTYFWVDPAEATFGLLMLQLNPVPEQLHRQLHSITRQALVDFV